jgi:hypothetical protein
MAIKGGLNAFVKECSQKAEVARQEFFAVGFGCARRPTQARIGSGSSFSADPARGLFGRGEA